MTGSNSIKKDFSSEEAIKVLTALGSNGYRTGSNGELLFQTVCHHGDSYKLYWYPESKMFHCYVCGESFDMYKLVMVSKSLKFKEALVYVYEILGIEEKEEKRGFIPIAKTQLDDWEIFNRYNKKKEEKKSVYNPKILPKTLIDYYPDIYPIEWLNDGITKEAMDKYNIRFDPVHNKIIIPQYDADGELVGIRGRALNPEDLDKGQKYMPVSLEDDVLRCPTAYNLYGLSTNKKAISSIGKILLFEAEKSVMKCAGFYGDNNFTVACYGSNISNFQRDLILSLGVKEVFIAFDKEYHTAFTPESDSYSEKILKLAYKFCPYVTTWVLWDVDGDLGYKDSPADCGKQTLEKLMKNKYEVTTVTQED